MPKRITLENLAGMIKRGFDENTDQHKEILKILDKHAILLIGHTSLLKEHTSLLKGHTALLKEHTERLKRIEAKLEDVVHRKEFEELKARVEGIEKALAMKKKYS